MYRPNGLNRILMVGTALAQLAARVPIATPLPDATAEKKLERRFARHTHRPKGMGSLKYSSIRACPRGATSTLRKTARPLAKQATEAHR